MTAKKGRKKCEPGCKGRIVNASRGTYCKCISSLLPRGSQQSIDAELWDDIDETSGFALLEPAKPRIEEHVIEAELLKKGCTETEMRMVMDRKFEELTLEQIKEKYGYTTPQSADRALEQIYKKLRNAGFSFESEGGCNG